MAEAQKTGMEEAETGKVFGSLIDLTGQGFGVHSQSSREQLENSKRVLMDLRYILKSVLWVQLEKWI